MSAAATQAPLRGITNSRRVPRFPLSVPADVTVLRSGIPHSIPGRTVTLGERGLGLVLAGEVHPGDSADLDFNLPDFGGRLQLKAVVRYQALLKCGLEFQSLTPQQQRLIEHWTRTKSVTNPNPVLPVASSEFPAPPIETATAVSVEAADQKNQHAWFQRAARLIFTGLLVFGGLYWWHWRQTWDELESRIPATKPLSQQSAVYVPPEVMQGHVIHKIEPMYPEAARQANTQGVVALDVVIGPDGTVVEVLPISGPHELTPAAVDAVKWWRFQPYLINGRAVQVKTTLAVDFRGN
jgi:TonB family protein